MYITVAHGGICCKMKNLILGYLKNSILRGWIFERALRLAFALIILFEAFQNYDLLLAVLGAVLFAQVLLNKGCCGMNDCDTNQYRERPRSSKESAEEITFKEVKNDN